MRRSGRFAAGSLRGCATGSENPLLAHGSCRARSRRHLLRSEGTARPDHCRPRLCQPRSHLRAARTNARDRTLPSGALAAALPFLAYRTCLRGLPFRRAAHPSRSNRASLTRLEQLLGKTLRCQDIHAHWKKRSCLPTQGTQAGRRTAGGSGSGLASRSRHEGRPACPPLGFDLRRSTP